MNRNHEPPGQTANQRTAARIRGKMAEQRLTFQDIGDCLGITRQAAGRRLTGETEWTVNDLEKIGRRLGTTAQELMG